MNTLYVYYCAPPPPPLHQPIIHFHTSLDYPAWLEDSACHKGCCCCCTNNNTRLSAFPVSRFACLYSRSCLKVFKFYILSVHTGCLLNIVFFSQEFSKVCHLSLASTWLHWLYKKLPANRRDFTIALRWELWRCLTAMRRGRGCS